MKTCSKCGEQKDPGQFHKRHAQCKECHAKVCAEWRARNPAYAATSSKKWRDANLERNRQGQRNLYAKRRATVLAGYGGRCQCCGEDREIFLAIDHIDGGGNAHRREIGRNAGMLYVWLIKNGFPGGFQILCHNCNYAKYRGVCPHREDAAVTSRSQ